MPHVPAFADSLTYAWILGALTIALCLLAALACWLDSRPRKNKRF